MRPDGDGRLKTLRSGPRSVLVSADARYAASHAGQHLLQMTVNLLARQYEVIDKIILDVPNIDSVDGVFIPRRSPIGLRSELVALGKAIAGPEIAISELQENPDIDVTCTILVGHSAPTLRSGFRVSTVAEGWCLDCATNRLTATTPGTDPNPAGPYMAACFAVGAVFKFFWQLDAQVSLTASLWGCTQGQWNELPRGKSPVGIQLPTTYLIGAGAVGAAFAFTVAATPEIAGEMVVIDPQKSDDTNRNRLLTMSFSQVEQDKAVLLEQLFAQTKVKIYPYSGPWPEYTLDLNRSTPQRLREVEKTYRYEWVISCVDRNHHRKSIAVYLPRHVLGGSTQDFVAQAALYSLRGECECLACNHPVPLVRPTEELRQHLLGLSLQELENWFAKHDTDLRQRAAIEEYLRDPSCGTVGQALLAKLGRDGETDWSAGFVSVAAGVLLESSYMRVLLEGFHATLANGSESFAWFLGSSLATSFALRKPICDVCGDNEKQSNYGRLWRESEG
jgi:hypothetical protein